MSRRHNRGNHNARGRSRPSKRVGLLSRLLRNRYREGSNWVSVGDVIANVKETFYCFTHRVPPNSRLLWRNNKIVGFSSQWRGPR